MERSEAETRAETRRPHSRDVFIQCCTALHYAVTQSIPCLRKTIQQWQETKRKTISPCQRPRPRPASNPQECSEKGKPTSSSSCASCVAWGKAVEDDYYPQKSKGDIRWNDINPTCLAGRHFMVAKVFLRLQRPFGKCTSLEHLDLAGLLDIMMRFKEFLGGDDGSTFDIFKKVRTIFVNSIRHLVTWQF